MKNPISSYFQLTMALVLMIILGVLIPVDQTFAELTADEIIAKVRDRDDGQSFISNVVLKLVDSNARVRERQMYMVQKDDATGREDVFMEFHSPGDVRGVSFMMSLYPEVMNKADDQWLYLPAFRKTRRIGSNDQRGKFMGSTFNYSDLTKIKVSDYHSTIIGESDLNGRDTWVIERNPASEVIINKTGYYKQKIWVDKERFLVLKYEYFDIKGVNFKTQYTQEVKKIQDIWTITHSKMVQEDTGNFSEMLFHDLTYNIEIVGNTFSNRTMRKGLRQEVIALLNQ